MLGPAQAAVPCEELVPTALAERDFHTHVRQAKHFERKGWLPDATREAAMARNTPAGRGDPVAWALSARLARTSGDIVAARCLAAAALELNKSGAATEEARALLRELDRSFGYVTIFSEGNSVATTLRIEPPRLFSSAELQEYTLAQIDVHRQRQQLPVHLALPAGAYVINGQSITLVPGEAQEMVLSASRTRPAWASPTARATTGVVLRAAQNGSPPPVVPYLRSDLTLPLVRQPSWSVRGGLMGGVELPGAREDGIAVPAAGELGAMFSGVWSTAAGLELRADLSASRAAVSGIGVACPLDGGACDLDAGSEPGVPVDVVAARSSGWRTGAIVGVEHRRFGQIQWLGVGAAAGWSRSWGALTSDTVVDIPGSPSLAVADWSVDGIHFGVSVSFHR
jgi:hypothetical protein